MSGSGTSSSWSIRKKLLLLLLLIFLPASGLMVASSLTYRTDTIREAENSALLLVRSLAAGQEGIAAGTRQMLRALACLPEVKNLDAAACTQLFRELSAKYPVYSSISAATPDGAVFACSGPLEPGASSLSGSKSFREAVRTLDFSAGDYAESKAGQVPSIYFSYPVLDADKKPLAVMCAGLRLDECARLLTQSGLPQGCHFAVADHNGRRMFSFPENAADAPGVPVSKEAIAMMSGDRQPGKYEKTSQDGIDRIYAFERLRLKEGDSPYLYLIVSGGNGRALHAADMKLLGYLGCLGVLAVFAIVLVRMSANRLLIKPINVETRAAELARANTVLRLEIAERRKAEQALRAVLMRAEDEKSRSESIIAGISDGLTMIDGNFKIVYQNETSKAIAGDGAGQYCHVATHNRDHVCEQCPVLKCFEDGEMHKIEKSRVVKGKTIYCEIAASPIRNATGEITGGIELARDITQRKLAEERLKSSEERLKILFECAPDPYYLTDLEGKIVDGNRAAQRITGYARKELLGKNLLELGLLPPEDMPRALEVLARCAAGHPSGPDEFSLKRKDGTTVFLESRSFPTVIGGQMLLLGIARDITKRKQAEEALMESQQRLGDIIDFLPDATFVIDREKHVIAWNRAMEEMTGTSAAAILGKDGYEYALPFHGERKPILINLVLDPNGEAQQHYLTLEKKGGVLAGQIFIPSLKGRASYLFGTASALYDPKGNVVGAIESIRDITNHKLMEEAVARAEEKFREIFENSVTGIYQVGTEGRFLSLNMSTAHILGYDSPEELLSRSGDVSQLYVHQERRSELYRLIGEQGSVRELEVEFFRKDKSVVWVALNVRAVRNPAGEITHLEGTASDITDRKLLRAQLDQAQKMEAIGTLAGGIAHDFNNILTPIIGYTELSLNAVPEDGRLSHNMRQVLLSANRAKDLVRQILTFSRKTEQERKPVQVGLIIKEALKLLRSSLPSTIDIRQSLHPDAIYSTTMADPTQIHQVLMNLCTNAAYAMRAKGGTLSVTLECVEIGQRAGRAAPDMEPGPYLRLSVADTGHGMADTVKHRIFDPYFTTKGPNEGTGLGLAVVYGIVKNLSGAIAVSSEPGEGSAFDVYLPRVQTIRTPMATPSDPLPTGQGVILVVDDEKFIVDMVKEMLDTLGYETVPRYSSSDALETFRARPESFDLVITDMTMPNMTGIDLAKEIFMTRPHTPLILCTGFSETVDEKKMKPLGIKELLMKPVSMRDLAVAVNKILVPDRRATLIQ